MAVISLTRLTSHHLNLDRDTNSIPTLALDTSWCAISITQRKRLDSSTLLTC